jgi:hypothetical protein
MPAGFIRKDSYGITEAARRYLEPLIAERRRMDATGCQNTSP